MAILANGRLFTRRITGVERYGREILRCLGDRVQLVLPPKGSQQAGGHLWEQFVLPRRIPSGSLLFSPANTGPVAVANQVLVVHDLSPLEHPEWFAPTFSLWYRMLLPTLVGRVRQIVVSSQQMSGKLRRRSGLPAEKITVAAGGVDREHFHPGYPPPAGLPERYLLFVGTLQPRKNLGVLIQAWERTARRFPDTWLVVAGGAEAKFRRPALPVKVERVRYLGYVSDGLLPGLYAGAKALVLPSYDEGFGLPVLEAMACGTPVIAARAGGLPEAVGQAGLLFDPYDPDQLSGLLEGCLADRNLHLCLVEQGLRRAREYSWQRPAEQIWEVLQACL